jgi:hypothetical protein
MIFSKICIIYFNSFSPEEGDVRIDYYDSIYACEQISKWLMRKIPTSILVMKSPSTELRLLRRKFLFMRMYTFKFPVQMKCDSHIWTLTTGQWEHHSHLVIIV